MSDKEKAERRDGKRAETDDRIEFTIDGASFPGRILNLSHDGCMIEGDCVTATAGREISVTLVAGYAMAGTIAWKNGARIGIGFHQPLVEATLRYFQLRKIEHETHRPPADQFGRNFPPLRPTRDLS